MSIYDDVMGLEALLNECVNTTTGEISDENYEAYQALQQEITVGGLERCAHARVNKLARIDGIKAEIERLKNAIKRETGSLEWLERTMLAIWDKSPKDIKGKVQAGTFTIGTRRSSSVELEPDFQNAKYQTSEIVVKTDKMAIKKALSAGEVIPGATLKENLNLTVL